MSEPNPPGDVPPEYAEAYRRGYERALGGRQPAPGGGPAEDRTQVSGPLFADEPEGAEPTQVLGSLDAVLHRAPDDEAWTDDATTPAHERPAWLVPALLAGMVVLLLGSAFGIGKFVSSHMGGGAATAAGGSGVSLGPDSGSAGGQGTHAPTGKKYDGPTQAAAIGGATATCQAPEGVDAAGHPVTYAPKNVYDGDLTTAWRCDGSGVGQKLTLQLPARTAIGQVGLVPGYAKTDPRTGADRYAENNRITKVRWLFGDGTAVVQTFDGSAANREMQNIRIPLTKAGRVTVEVLASTRGPRNTIAVSEVRLGSPG